MSHTHRFRALLPVLILTANLPAFADTPRVGLILGERLQEEEQRRRAFDRQMQPEADVRLQNPAEPSLPDLTVPSALPQNESPCFAVGQIVLAGNEADRFQYALDKAVGQSGFEPCLLYTSPSPRD